MDYAKKYIMTGRYMNGTGVIGYHLVSSSGDEQRKVTREQFIFMLGRDMIANCTGQLSGNQVIIRGVNDFNINDVPIYDEKNKIIRNIEKDAIVKPKNNSEQVLGQLTIIGRITDGRNNIGFVLRNFGGQQIRMPRDEVMALAENKMITNAFVQNYNGKKILRGYKTNLKYIPETIIKK